MGLSFSVSPSSIDLLGRTNTVLVLYSFISHRSFFCLADSVRVLNFMRLDEKAVSM